VPQILELRPLRGTEHPLNSEQHHQAVTVHFTPPVFNRRDAVKNELFIGVGFAQKVFELLFERTEGRPSFALGLHEFVKQRVDTVSLESGQADDLGDCRVFPPSGGQLRRGSGTVRRQSATLPGCVLPRWRSHPDDNEEQCGKSWSPRHFVVSHRAKWVDGPPRRHCGGGRGPVKTAHWRRSGSSRGRDGGRCAFPRRPGAPTS
jgi:hypothetical protein